MPETAACPKCGFPNKSEAEKCANCFAPLKAPPAPTMQQQRIRPEVKPAYDPQPVKTGANVGLIVIVVLVLIGAGGGTMLLVKSNQHAAPPKPTVPAEVVAEQFLVMKRTGELAKVRPYLSAASKEKLDKSFSTRQARSAGFDKAEVARMCLFNVGPSRHDLMYGKVTVLRPAKVDAQNDQAVVSVKLESEDELFSGSTATYEFVMVNEGGVWKFDIDLTKDKNGLGDIAIPVGG